MAQKLIAAGFDPEPVASMFFVPEDYFQVKSPKREKP